MSINPESDGIATLIPHPDGIESVALPAEPAHVENPAQAPAHTSPEAARSGRARPRWAVLAAIAALGIIASGTLTGFLVTTIGQRDTARHQLAATQATLAGTKRDLSAAQAEATARKRTDDYVSLYVVNSGRVQTDYQTFNLCKSYSSCRTAAQQVLTDLQAFQSARSSANVPTALSNSDSQLGDSLSAAIAAVQQIIVGMDSDDTAKFKDGYQKLDAAMLSMAKAEAALGAEIK